MEDNYSIWEQHQRELDAALSKRPVCECCGNHIQDDYTWNIDGELLCDECAADRYRKHTEDFMDESS